MAIYTRQENSAGQWRYQRVNTGKGRNRADLQPPFYFRHALGGKRVWTELKATVLLEAKTEVDAIETALEAHAKGLTVAELAESDMSRLSLKTAIEKFLDLKRSKAPRTVAVVGYSFGRDRPAILTRVGSTPTRFRQTA
jgi:hypothetical protein